ncbi:Uncharacterized mitochondrial protein AtMg00860 [Striga hermonthica]|uniref:Uncharacterized mitochondrial protein AtMg00860 n=1 Tax=Striga hermonthica TaxID=68872 RepID=A0A9N7R675_STRHE|nr:Uncharacterized mitochondrial protein AtMg00860 [Striga hermonthica]
MDGAKVKAIMEWQAPTKVTELRSFLGLVNYYRRFIQGYSTRAVPLTDLLKKGKPWVWSDECERAFDDLKVAVSQESVLALPDFTKPFEVHTDASDFAIGGVLMKERHAIAFDSRKLNDTERRYTVQEKEMTTIIHCLRAELAAISKADEDVLSRVREGLEGDPVAKALIGLAKEGKTQRFWVEDGHPGQRRTVALLETNYFWPQLKDDVETYVRTCLVCQQDKIENRHPAGLLEPLPIPAGPWDSITLDFISSLPQSEGYGSIMVVVDRFSKYGIFILCSKDCTAEEAARGFFKNVG